MSEITKDLSALTTMQEGSLEKLVNTSIEVICHKIFEGIKNGEDTIKYDIGIGHIVMQNIDNEIFYKFIPSLKFEKSILSVYRDGKDPLIDTIENAIKIKINNAYKDLM